MVMHFIDIFFLAGSVYLDHIGAALYSEHLINSYTEDLRRNLYGNPHSVNQSSQLTDEVTFATRQR